MTSPPQLARKGHKAKPRRIDGLAQSQDPYLKRVRGSLFAVFRGRNSTDVRARTARNEMAHYVAAYHLAHWYGRHQRGSLDLTNAAGLQLIERFFPDVDGVDLDAVSGHNIAGAEYDGS